MFTLKGTLHSFVGVILILALVSCNVDTLTGPPTVTPQKLALELKLNKTEFAYDEEVSVTLSVVSEPGRKLSFDWTVDDQVPGFSIEDPKSFTFKMTPAESKTYSLKVKVGDGEEFQESIASFVVKQFPFVGTWKSTDVPNPAYGTNVDIVGIWKLDSFVLYYLDPNGGTTKKTYSAKGVMDFPTENTWIKLTETHYFDSVVDSWKPWTYTNGEMWVKYQMSTDLQSMTVELDNVAPADVAGYTWSFVKVSDSTSESY